MSGLRQNSVVSGTPYAMVSSLARRPFRKVMTNNTQMRNEYDDSKMDNRYLYCGFSFSDSPTLPLERDAMTTT